jgi:uncharacterized membrane protein YbhN (UPF0104 family)
MRPRQYHDPVTGDVLTLSEFVSWRLQSMIRNWWFIDTISVITVLMFIKWKVWEHDPLDQWNDAASWLALWVKSCVGIAMFSQTGRDAKIIRESRLSPRTKPR